MIRAVVFDIDAPFRGEGAAPSPVPAETRLAGLTLLRRAIMQAWNLGAQHVTVVARNAEAAARWSASEAGLPVPVTIIGQADELPRFDEDDRVLVLSAQILAEKDPLKRLLASQFRAEHSMAVAATGSTSSGPAVLTGRDITEALRREPDPLTAFRRVMRGADTLLVELQTYRRLDTPESVADADSQMYVGLTSITDGYIDRVFNRHISRWFTRRVINLPITPNQVTWFHFSLGLCAAWLFWQGGYAQGALGAVLFQLSVALDCSDGEIARLKYQFSKFGSWLDVWADNVVTVAVFAAIAKAAASRLGVPLAATLGALAVTGVLMCVMVIFGLARLQSRHHPGEASGLAATNRLSESDQVRSAGPATLVEKVINEATSRDFSVIVVAFALMGRLEWFAWLAGLGAHVFWIVFATIQLSMFRTANAQSR